MLSQLTTDVLIIGGTTSGTAAAIQAARQGVRVILVSEFEWLGGMLTSAGVAAPDGNELNAWQTGLWGAFLRSLEQRQPGGLHNAWVSFYTYEPRIGAEIFADWVKALPNLTWIANQTPIAVHRRGNRILGVQTQDYDFTAKVTIDATELGDLLPLGEIPYRWGWELQGEWKEPSAPAQMQDWMARYPVQAPTWVVLMQDYGEGQVAPTIEQETGLDFSTYDNAKFANACTNYRGEQFLNYGRLPGDRFMINWPICGNDYGEGLDRLIGTADERAAFAQEAQYHSLAFAAWIQKNIGARYGLAQDVFPADPARLHPALALHPYYRESRRLIGQVTAREQDILPQTQATAALPMQVSAMGCEQVDSFCTAIVLGNYPNDHHYPSGDIPLAPKSIQWGGRWTGTPFTLPYGAVIPQQVDGFFACEKNISVSHMTNGATRLQPIVLNLGQAVGLAAALCIEQGCEPRDLAVRDLQNALISDPTAPAAVIPLYNLPPSHPDWKRWQAYYLDHPEAYPRKGYAPVREVMPPDFTEALFSGRFEKVHEKFQITLHSPVELANQVYPLVVQDAVLNFQLQHSPTPTIVSFNGILNPSGPWILVSCQWNLRNNSIF